MFGSSMVDVCSIFTCFVSAWRGKKESNFFQQKDAAYMLLQAWSE